MKDVKIFARTIEPDAKKQIQKMADSEAYRDCKIRIMPIYNFKAKELQCSMIKIL